MKGNGKKLASLATALVLTLTLSLALLMVLGLAVPAYASSGDFVIRYGILEEYTGPGGAVTIPSSVTEIGDYAFSCCNSLTSITIPDRVTKIGESAFISCTNLTSVTIPSSVTEIGRDAFSGCNSLTSITIPGSVTKIGYMAFSGCDSLTSVTFQDGVTSIGESAFSSCDSLTSITIPNSVTEIDHAAFSGCTSLTSITIPNSVTKIGYMAFYDCDNLTSVTIPDSVTEIDAWAFRGCTSLTNVTMPVRLYLPTASFISTLFWLPGDDFRNIFDGPFIATPWGIFQAVIQVSVLAALTAILIISLKAWHKNKEQSDPEGYARKKQEKQKRKEAATVRSGMVTCSCGAVNPTSAAFCSKCGKPVVVPGRCECGHQNDPEAQFCQKCGKPLPGREGRTEQPEASGPATVETAQTDSTLVKPAAPVNRTPLIVAIVAGAALLVLWALLILRPQLGPQPSPTSDPDQSSQSQQDPEQDPAAALVGTWANEDGVGLRFTSDGTVTLSGFGINLGGDTFSYEVTGENELTLTAEGDLVSADIEVPYGILDDTLYIEIGGGTYTLTKK